MNRIMGDSASGASAIPTWVDIACAYTDGHIGVETQAQLEARFPHARYGQVWIDVTGAAAPAADVRDWETGDKAGSLEAWVIDHNKAAGRKNAVVYCDRDTIPEVRRLTGSQVLGTDYWLWISTLDGTLFTPQDYPHVIACQLLGSRLAGGNWDMSVVFDGTFWLPVTPAPKPPVDPSLLDVFELAVKTDAQVGQILAILQRAGG